MIKIHQYTSEYLFKQRPELIEYLEENLNNIAEGLYSVGSGMLNDLAIKRRAIIFIAWENGEPIAWGNLTYRRYDTQMQVGIYVHPNHRRRGIGSRIATKMLNWAKNTNRRLVCHPWNLASEDFYSVAGIQYEPAWEFSEERL